MKFPAISKTPAAWRILENHGEPWNPVYFVIRSHPMLKDPARGLVRHLVLPGEAADVARCRIS